MEISKGIRIVGTALWLDRMVIINDLHLGYEESLQRKGVLVPRFQLQEVIQQLEKILNVTKPEKVIINGDLKHEFSKVLSQEWKEVLSLLDFLLRRCKEVVIIQGNHDSIIRPIAEKKNVQVVQLYKMGDTMVVHGDRIVKTEAKRMIIGHEHPAITIREGSKLEKYKCFLRGQWRKKEVIAIPSFNPLLEGTDILKEELLSPYLQKIDEFEVYVVNKGETFGFGKVKAMRKGV